MRFGTYTIYKGHDLRLIENNDFYRLVYDGAKCPFEDFIVYAENVYYKDVPQETVLNAFFIKTKGIYKGYRFDVFSLNLNNLIRIVTDEKTAYENLKLDCRDRGVYQKEIFLDELDELLEEYSPSSLNLSIPAGLPKERIIK